MTTGNTRQLRQDYAARRQAGRITYDDQAGHVCTCTEEVQRDADGNPDHATYEPTVRVARDIEPTESGSWYYSCSRCGAGAWSGL